MKRFFQPVCRSCRLPKILADRAVVVGLTLVFIASFSLPAFAAAPLLPKRTVPTRTPSQANPGRIVWPHSDSPDYVITKDSLIQQVAFDDEEAVRMVPPAPPLRKPLEAEQFLPSDDVSSEPEAFASYDSDDYEEEEDSFEEQVEQTEQIDIADFPPLDISQYSFPSLTELPDVSKPQSSPVPLQSPPSTFVSDYSSGGLASVPQYPVQTAPQAAPQGWPLLLGQTLPQAPYPAQPVGYGYPPYGYYQNPQAFVTPYGYGPYGYPNAPGAYWGPTGFAANPYAAYPGYPGYPPPYGYRPPNQSGDDGESLTSTTWETLGYFNPFKSPKGPNRGVGGPLMMRSWRDRPFYLGAFGGVMCGSELVSGLVDQGNGGTGGILFGWYADNYWGLESRLHFAGLPGKNTPNAQAVYEEWYKSQNQDATLVPLTGSRNNAISMFDVSIHYYPLGNAKWRPFLKLGLGTANQQFRDMYGVKHNYNSFMIPWGAGLKYWWNERIALHIELTDNVLFAVEETKTQNNVALTVGLNFPLGKVKRKAPVIYWPMMSSAGR